jgi:hypothetical protein
LPRTYCKALGVILLLVGVLGFANPWLLGMHLTPLNDVLHLMSAGAALYFATQAARSTLRTVCLAFGAMYLALAAMGYLAPDVMAATIGYDAQANANDLVPDTVAHILMGGAFLLPGLVRVRRVVGPHREVLTPGAR